MRLIGSEEDEKSTFFPDVVLIIHPQKNLSEKEHFSRFSNAPFQASFWDKIKSEHIRN